MTLSYLLISSAYRNRLLYPNPGDFVIPIGTINNPNSSALNVFLSTNPISFTLPDYNFCWTNFYVPPDPDPIETKYKQFVFKTQIVAGTAVAPLLAENVNRTLLGLYRNAATVCPSSHSHNSQQGTQPPNLSLVQEPQYCFGILRGWVLVVVLPDGAYAIRDILDYDPSTRVALLRNPIPEFSLSTGPLVAYVANLSKTDNPDCPTVEPEQYPIFARDLLGSIVFANGKFLARASTVYFNYAVFLYDVTINEIAIVEKYQSGLQVFSLCKYFSCAWSVTDQYWVLSRNLPMAVGSILTISEKGPFYNRSFIEDYTFLEKGRGYALGQDVLLVNELNEGAEPTLARVVRVGLGGSVEDVHFLSVSTNPYRVGDKLVVQRVQTPVVPLEVRGETSRDAVMVVRNTSLVFRCRLKPGTFRVQDFVGNYLVSVLASPQYRYEPSSRSVYLSPNATIPARNDTGLPVDLLRSQNQWGATGIRKVTSLEDDVYLFYVQPFFGDRLSRFDVIHENLDDLPPYFQGWNHLLITQFSSEGVVPLNYTGSQITQSQMTCHEMTVMNLILPNKIINSPQGLLTSAYPYVFLELSNETMPSGHNRALVYSNNPSAVRATFVCSISDVNNPETTRFIKINSDGAAQVLKFSPYDNLRLRVTLPSGQPFLTEEVDTLVPCDPDVTLQISVVFQINRL